TLKRNALAYSRRPGDRAPLFFRPLSRLPASVPAATAPPYVQPRRLVGAGPDPQVELLHVLVGAQLVGGALEHEAPALEHVAVVGDRQGLVRSEEHTSELQSRENLVCRLLLE